MLAAILGTPIRQDAQSFSVQEGDAVATYSRQYYRLANERPAAAEPIAICITDPLPLELAGAEHMIAVPTRP